MNLTPLQINASAGLLDNQGLCANTQQNSGYAIYLDSPLIKPLIETISIANNNSTLTNATLSSLKSMSPACPALSNSSAIQVLGSASATELYSTMGISSLTGRMVSNIITAGTSVTITCGGNTCIGTVNTCGNITPSGEFTNLIDANANTKFTDFDLSGCFKTTKPTTVDGIHYPFLVGDFVEYPKDGNIANVAWIGKCWAQDKDYDLFVEKLHNLYLGAGGVLDNAISNQSNTQSSYDYTIFVQAYNAVQGYMNQANQFIGSANIGQSYLDNTFTGMSDLITGTLSSINPNIKGFATDLNNLGKLINMNTLNDLGSPLNLVRQIINVAGYLPVLSLAFLTVGIDQPAVGAIGSASANVSDETQKLMYKALSLITDDALAQILKVLDIKTAGLTTAADLLNPQKMFPNSYKTLKTLTPNGYTKIYSGQGVNTTLKTALPAYVLRSTA